MDLPKKNSSLNRKTKTSLTNKNDKVIKTDDKCGKKRTDKNMMDILERVEDKTNESLTSENELRTVTSMVQKWGNSLAIRIPKDMADHIAISQGSAIKIIETKSGLKIVPSKPKFEFTLEDLLSQCKPENRHETVDFGIVGKELF